MARLVEVLSFKIKKIKTENQKSGKSETR